MMLKHTVIILASVLSPLCLANVFDLADIKTGDMVSFCPTAIDIQQSSESEYDKAYYCHGEISLEQDEQIINSKNTHVQLRAFTGLNLKGRNTIGSPENPIGIKSLSQGIIISNTNHETDYTYIYGDIKTNYAISLENVLIDGDVDSEGMTVELKGLYNVVNGQVTASQNLKLENAQVCGDVWSSGGLVEIGANKNIIVGGLFSLQNLTLSNTDVFGAIESKGANITLNKTSVYAKHNAIKAFHTASFVDGIGQVCGRIKAHRVDNDITQYCGKNDPGCSYATNNCPEKEIPVCELVPPTNDDFDLVVTPTDDMALMCGEDLPQFTVITTNNGKTTSETVTTSLSHHKLFNLEMVTGNQQSGVNQFVSDDNGKLVLRIVPKDINKVSLNTNYTLTFTMAEDTSKQQTVNFMFTPFMFEAYSVMSGKSLDDIKVIAGKEKDVHMRLLACTSGDQPVIASNYNGSPTVQPTITQPKSGKLGDFKLLNDFKNGESEESKLKTYESGQFRVELSDSFQCADYEDCPSSGSVLVTGSFNVSSRPWTLAICGGSTPLASGTSESGEGFIAAGDYFSLSVKPIVWQNKALHTDEVNTSNYCNARVASNFMMDDAPAASIVLTSSQQTPKATAEQTHTLLRSSNTLKLSHTESENSRYYFSQLVWDEVGSLKIKAQLDTTYLGMTVNTGYRNIGRFYPKYFKVQSQDWTYPKNQGFVYMNQPFEKVTYDVVALNANKEDVKNYAHFAPSLQQHFYLGELGGYQDRFVPPAPQKAEWKRIGDASIGQFVIEKASTNATCHNSPCWEKDITKGQYPDGPFNRGANSKSSKIGLVTTHVVDEVNFFDGGEILTKQPDIRFGRLNFKDVGGNQGMKIKVPLDVEVWQNGRFVTNFDDNSTTANGAYYTSTPIWSNAPVNNALLSGVAKMSVGRTNDIIASQIDAAREQIQFSLNLDHSGNQLPWLKYDWETSTPEEENPPTIVTFGIHRGNDRIIYRGEPNMLGLN
ncbi:polymer-forming cytoskeletal protein [Vibrio parahaemolyticus]|nr:polymer-forming cytoskeletal protein [Vibrio parahaemolyticus]